MKLYNVFSLYVVKKEDNYFICKNTNKPNIYIEFFTKEKIEVKKEEVENLSKYYSLLGVKNYKTKGVLKLSKKQILLKYLEINQKENIKEYIDGEEFLQIEEENPEQAKEIVLESLGESKNENDSLFFDVWQEYEKESVAKTKR